MVRLFAVLAALCCSSAVAADIDLRRWEPMSQGGYAYPIREVYHSPCRSSGYWLPQYLITETVYPNGNMTITQRRLPDRWVPTYYDDSWRWQQNTGYGNFR